MIKQRRKRAARPPCGVDSSAGSKPARWGVKLREARALIMFIGSKCENQFSVKGPRWSHCAADHSATKNAKLGCVSVEKQCRFYEVFKQHQSDALSQ